MISRETSRWPVPCRRQVLQSISMGLAGLAVLGLPIACATTTTQTPTVFENAPAASWIAPADVPGDAFSVFHARKSFSLSTVPEQFVVHVSADNRYRLLVNGDLVSTGPQRSDLAHWRYETLDLAAHLRVGTNLLAVVAWNWGPNKPIAQFTHRSAFLMQGHTPFEASLVNSDQSWKILHNPAYEPLPVSGRAVGGYYAAPPGESVDGTSYPWGWETPAHDDAGWPDAAVVEVMRLSDPPAGGAGSPWQLVPRSIPQMEETPVRFDRVRRAQGIDTDGAFLAGTADLVIPPNTTASVLIDQAHLTNAYAVVRLSGGTGSTLSLTYAEALKDADGQKGNRHEIEGKTISGVRDVIRPDGGPDRRYQTLWFRTYRYVQLDVETADETLRLHDMHGIFTGYPFELTASFSSDLDWLTEMWEMNWRVARLCAGETYYDTPYYEQLQYIGDTRIQALISLYMSGDDRLVRQAISHFDDSRIPEGITASRYPSEQAQYIPTFSLIWVAMVHDYWMHRDDEEYVQTMLPGIRGVLAWFEALVDDTGLVGPVGHWPYVDWAEGWQRGQPPGATDGHSVMISLQFAYALQRAAELEAHLGQPAEAARFSNLADGLISAARSAAWDERRRVFRDAIDAEDVSQQTNTMAVLVGAVPADEQAEFMERILADTSMTQATYYYSYYVLEALRQAGLADEYIDHLAPWQTMLSLGLTTTPERPEPTRSDSHAWSAHPNYGLLATVLGIRPAEPGFRSVRIRPALGDLEHAEGVMPHPRGPIEVQLRRTPEGGLHATITLPEGLTGTFQWQDQETSLHGGTQEVTYR